LIVVNYHKILGFNYIFTLSDLFRPNVWGDEGRLEISVKIEELYFIDDQ